MRVDDKVCLITYLNAFDGKTAYQLRDKDPRTLREPFRMAINVENNQRIMGRLESKRDDPRLFGGKGNKREDHKISGGKKQESSEMSQVLNAIKSLSFPQVKTDRNPTDNRTPYQSNFNRQNRLQNFPYNTTWKDGQPSVPPPKNNTNKVTPDPLSKHSVNLVDDPELGTEITWCFACQLPHSPKSCAVAVSYAENQNIAEDCH